MSSDNTAGVSHWQCIDCLALNSPDSLTCSGCGDYIPTDEPPEVGA